VDDPQAAAGLEISRRWEPTDERRLDLPVVGHLDHNEAVLAPGSNGTDPASVMDAVRRQLADSQAKSACSLTVQTCAPGLVGHEFPHLPERLRDEGHIGG